jgi:hypothetical protein
MPALVNLSNEGYDRTFRIHYLDQDLLGVLPEGKLVFSLSEGLKQPAHLSSETAFRLVGSTIDACPHFLVSTDKL